MLQNITTIPSYVEFIDDFCTIHEPRWKAVTISSNLAIQLQNTSFIDAFGFVPQNHEKLGSAIVRLPFARNESIIPHIHSTDHYKLSMYSKCIRSNNWRSRRTVVRESLRRPCEDVEVGSFLLQKNSLLLLFWPKMPS